ncbi:MAG: acetate/propionate family kinase [Alphaproteobacteria bacterium]|nr:acetate/propionate family kinase [Alphaproteobacteria bacterium]
MNTYVLVLNGGSSSLKFALYEGKATACVGRGAINAIGIHPVMSAKGSLFEEKGATAPTLTKESCESPADATKILLDWMEPLLPANSLKAVGHRVVHGGHLTQAMEVRPHLLAYLKTLIPLAPLHQPFNLETMEMVMRLHPKVPQIACFDTAFHTTIPALHRRYAIPRVWHDKGLRRYGFHGLSYEFISGRLKEISPRAFAGRTVVAHLGNGASLCALKGGKSFDTTMGFSVLEGLMMGTRPGNIDAGILLYFMREAGLDEASIERMLYHDCGLKGVSNISSDMAELLASHEPAAREAIDLFCLRVVREIGALISPLGGLDSLVFTGGIGEHSPAIHEQIAAALSWIGVELDSAKNAAADGSAEVLISTPQSKTEVWLVPTNEELVIARHTRALSHVRF